MNVVESILTLSNEQRWLFLFLIICERQPDVVVIVANPLDCRIVYATKGETQRLSWCLPIATACYMSRSSFETYMEDDTSATTPNLGDSLAGYYDPRDGSSVTLQFSCGQIQGNHLFLGNSTNWSGQPNLFSATKHN